MKYLKLVTSNFGVPLYIEIMFVGYFSYRDNDEDRLGYLEKELAMNIFGSSISSN